MLHGTACVRQHTHAMLDHGQARCSLLLEDQEQLTWRKAMWLMTHVSADASCPPGSLLVNCLEKHSCTCTTMPSQGRKQGRRQTPEKELVHVLRVLSCMLDKEGLKRAALANLHGRATILQHVYDQIFPPVWQRLSTLPPTQSTSKPVLSLPNTCAWLSWTDLVCLLWISSSAQTCVQTVAYSATFNLSYKCQVPAGQTELCMKGVH